MYVSNSSSAFLSFGPFSPAMPSWSRKSCNSSSLSRARTTLPCQRKCFTLSSSLSPSSRLSGVVSSPLTYCHHLGSDTLNRSLFTAAYKSAIPIILLSRFEEAIDLNAVFFTLKDNLLLVLKFSAKQLNRVKHQLEPEVAHFEHTQEGLGIAHLETEPVLFVFKTPVTEIQLSVTLNFDFKFVTAGSNEADYLLHDLSLRCEPLETEYDDYMTYYQNMEYQNELPSFEEFFKKAHYHSDLVFAGYQSKPAFLRDFEQKFVTSDACKQIEALYSRIFKIMEENSHL